MAFRMNLWSVDGPNLNEVATSDLDLEDRLEDWLAQDPSLLGIDLLIIGRQVQTEYGGRIDLLGLDGEANTYVLELKRGRTPRDVVAQVLDYASWVKELTMTISTSSAESTPSGTSLKRLPHSSG